MSEYRILLSGPEASDDERDLLLDAFDSNWLAPVGPHVDAFEREVAVRAGVAHAAALSSGTAALDLALRLVGVGRGDRVIVPSFTFVATVAPLVHLGAVPVFVDSEPGTWNLDPDLVAAELARPVRERPTAVVAVDLYGQCADYARLQQLCAESDVPLVEDAAEALGATWTDRPAGSFGACATFSFNGNKIVTASGGGMLVSDDQALITRARYLASQARAPAPHYEHVEIGFNYRMSNLCAALGRGQLHGLDRKINRRRAIFDRYRAGLGDLPGMTFMPEAVAGRATRWLTVITVDPAEAGVDRESIRRLLDERGIEARPAWKPMHLQPVFAGAEMRAGAVCERIFRDGLCLPSGSGLTDADIDTVIAEIRAAVPAS